MKSEEFLGQQFGLWTVKDISSKDKLLCVCQCGTQREVSKYSLLRGVSTSCGCRAVCDLTDKRDEIIAYRNQGLTVKEIGAIYGISRTHMGRWIQKLGLSEPSDRTDVTTDMVVQLYQDGKTANEIAQLYHIGCDAILKRLRKVGIEPNRTENIKKHFTAAHDQLWEQIEFDLNHNMTKLGIVKKYHIRIDNLNRLMQNHRYVRKYQGHGSVQDLRTRLESKMVSNTEAKYLRGLIVFYESFRRWPTVTELADQIGLRYVSANEGLKKYGLKDAFIDVTPNYGQMVTMVEDWLRHCTDRVERNNQKLLDGLEIDFWCPSVGVGFEVNPTTSHSPDGTEHYRKPLNYHANKSKVAYEKKIPLVHIYDYDVFDERRWEILKQQIYYRLNSQNLRVVGARQCRVREISTKLCNQFLDDYHLQGSERNSEVRYGLFCDDELLSVMTFGNGRYQDNVKELIRYAVRFDVGVTGGFQKLWNTAVKRIFDDHDLVISYYSLDKVWHYPSVYERANFDVDEWTKPGYVWVNTRTHRVLKRYAVQRKLRLKMYPDDDKLSEVQCMRKHGYMRVYDAGNIRWKKEILK